MRRATHYDNYNLHCVEISIHALLAESDKITITVDEGTLISIHALLAESDINGLRHRWASFYFYPRSPCGERPQTVTKWASFAKISIHALLAESDPELDALANKPPFISIHALLAESDTKEEHTMKKAELFLSTLSLRRATPGRAPLSRVIGISIHALLAESDANWFDLWGWRDISIHALLAESDLD